MIGLSPDPVGKIHVQSDTIAAIAKHLNAKGADEVICNIAARANRDASGRYLSVQLSPPYVPQEQQPQPENSLDFIFGVQEGD